MINAAVAVFGAAAVALLGVVPLVAWLRAPALSQMQVTLQVWPELLAGTACGFVAAMIASEGH